MVADPACYKRSEKLWDLSIILNEASKRAGGRRSVLDHWPVNGSKIIRKDKYTFLTYRYIDDVTAADKGRLYGL